MSAPSRASDSPSNTAVRTRNERYSVFEPTIAVVGFLTVMRLRAQILFRPRIRQVYALLFCDFHRNSWFFRPASQRPVFLLS
jgi:hypothetical protein